MIKLNDDLLEELGLGSLPPEEKKKILAHIYETLEMRVGMKLAEQMTDAQLDEFEQFINRNDEAGALKWLETNFPNYKDVVAQEFEALKVEIRQAAPQILAAAQQAVMQFPQQPTLPPAYPQQPAFQQPLPPQAPAAYPPQPAYGYPQPPQQPQRHLRSVPGPGQQPPQPLPPQPYYPQQSTEDQQPPQMPAAA